MVHKKDGKDLELITNYCDWVTSRLLITNRFYWNIKKLPSGIRPFGFFILLPPLSKLENFVNNNLPCLEPHQKSTVDLDEDKQKAIKKQLAKLRLKNETSNKSI